MISANVIAFSTLSGDTPPFRAISTPQCMWLAFLESVGPVVTAPGVDLDRLVVQMDLHAVAVELDFVNPSRSGRHPPDRG